MRQSPRCLKLGDLFQAAAPRTHGGGIFQSPTFSSGRRHKENSFCSDYQTQRNNHMGQTNRNVSFAMKIIWVDSRHLFGQNENKTLLKLCHLPLSSAGRFELKYIILKQTWKGFLLSNIKSHFSVAEAFSPPTFSPNLTQISFWSCLQAAFFNKFIICHFHLVASTTSSFPAGSKDANEYQVSLLHQEIRKHWTYLKNFWNGHCLTKYFFFN